MSLHEPAIAYFITPHGFGHASRSAAVMAELRRIRPGIRLELFTTCPREIFAQDLPDGFGYHGVTCDIGAVQTSPLTEDLPATCAALDRMLPFDAQWVGTLAQQIRRLGCRLVVCDIAALGIAVARRAGLPSLLVENFTWDWIYRGYRHMAPGLDRHIDYLAAVFDQARHRVQTPPLCRPVEGSHRVGPISRRPRTDTAVTRRRLGIPMGARMVLVSMGGVADRFDFLSRLPEKLPCRLVIPGANPAAAIHPQVTPLPTHSEFYHPDLMQAADAVIGKAGYSTIAEAYRQGIPFGHVQRPHSPEARVLEAFISAHLPSLPIDTADYASGRWIDRLPELLDLGRRKPSMPNGAPAVARLICELLGRGNQDQEEPTRAGR